MNLRARIILSTISVIVQEVLIAVICRWLLPLAGFVLSLPVVIAVMVVWAIYSGTAFWVATKTLRQEALIGLTSMVGTKGKTLSPLAPEGQVMIRGEIWAAKAVEGTINEGEEVTVVGQERLKLMVRRLGGD